MAKGATSALERANQLASKDSASFNVSISNLRQELKDSLTLRKSEISRKQPNPENQEKNKE